MGVFDGLLQCFRGKPNGGKRRGAKGDPEVCIMAYTTSRPGSLMPCVQVVEVPVRSKPTLGKSEASNLLMQRTVSRTSNPIGCAVYDHSDSKPITRMLVTSNNADNIRDFLSSAPELSTPDNFATLRKERGLLKGITTTAKQNLYLKSGDNLAQTPHLESGDIQVQDVLGSQDIDSRTCRSGSNMLTPPRTSGVSSCDTSRLLTSATARMLTSSDHTRLDPSATQGHTSMQPPSQRNSMHSNDLYISLELPPIEGYGPRLDDSTPAVRSSTPMQHASTASLARCSARAATKRAASSKSKSRRMHSGGMSTGAASSGRASPIDTRTSGSQIHGSATRTQHGRHSMPAGMQHARMPRVHSAGNVRTAAGMHALKHALDLSLGARTHAGSARSGRAAKAHATSRRCGPMPTASYDRAMQLYRRGILGPQFEQALVDDYDERNSMMEDMKEALRLERAALKREHIACETQKRFQQRKKLMEEMKSALKRDQEALRQAHARARKVKASKPNESKS